MRFGSIDTKKVRPILKLKSINKRWTLNFARQI